MDDQQRRASRAPAARARRAIVVRAASRRGGRSARRGPADAASRRNARASAMRWRCPADRRRAALAERRVHALRQRSDELERARRRWPPARPVRRSASRRAEADVLRDACPRTAAGAGAPRRSARASARGRARAGRRRRSVTRPARRVGEAHQEPRDRALAGAARTDQRGDLAGRELEIEPLERAARRGRGTRSRRLAAGRRAGRVGHRARPRRRALRRVRDRSPAGAVEHREDPLGGGRAVGARVELLADVRAAARTARARAAAR